MIFLLMLSAAGVGLDDDDAGTDRSIDGLLAPFPFDAALLVCAAPLLPPAVVDSAGAASSTPACMVGAKGKTVTECWPARQCNARVEAKMLASNTNSPASQQAEQAKSSELLHLTACQESSSLALHETEHVQEAVVARWCQSLLETHVLHECGFNFQNLLCRAPAQPLHQQRGKPLHITSPSCLSTGSVVTAVARCDESWHVSPCRRHN